MEIKIGRTSRQCSLSGVPFEHNQPIVSVLQVEEHSFERRDYDVQCWQDTLGEGAVAVWNTRFRDPHMEEQEPPEAYTPLRRIFYESAEMEDRENLAVAYLAAQLLRRQKVFRLLKESGLKEDGILVTLFADRHGDRIIEVRDPNLNYAELDKARIILMERLKELESPAPAVQNTPDEVEGTVPEPEDPITESEPNTREDQDVPGDLSPASDATPESEMMHEPSE